MISLEFQNKYEYIYCCNSFEVSACSNRCGNKLFLFYRNLSPPKCDNEEKCGMWRVFEVKLFSIVGRFKWRGNWTDRLE